MQITPNKIIVYLAYSGPVELESRLQEQCEIRELDSAVQEFCSGIKCPEE